MEYRLHVVRHAEGIHNPAHDKTIPDPPLTQKGIKQCERLSQIFPYKQDVGLVVTSPLRRTLQTALVGFQQTLDQKYYSSDIPGQGCPEGARLLLEPNLQAHSSRPCDTGSSQSTLCSEMPHLPWDELSFDPVFPAKEGSYATDEDSLRRRGHILHRTLEQQFAALAESGRPDIVVVSHGGFMKYVVLKEKMAFDSAGWRTFNVSFDEDHNMHSIEVV